MDPFSPDVVRGAYDAVADDYAVAFGDDLADLPLDREMLDAAIAAAEDDGWVLEAGCGPAPAAGYLSGRATKVLGLDLSGAMLTVAGARNPGLHRIQGDLRHVPLRTGCCSLVIAYYSLQHLPRGALLPALTELRRVLRPRGVLVVATHLGEGDVHVDEFLGHRVTTFAGALHRREELSESLVASGFHVDLERQRGPRPHEYDSQRIYLLARSRGSPSSPLSGRGTGT
jgi:SAM-dependent methyltransferase